MKGKEINESNTIIYGIKGIGVQKTIETAKDIEFELLRTAYYEELKNVLSKW